MTQTQLQDELMIPIEKYLDDFNKRLNTDNRIMFSAKFGDGKTHFFEEFKEKYKSDYLFLTIYPVNYQVENNKDIFELIKRDILFQLFRDIKENLVHYDIDLDAFTTSLFSKDTLDEFFDFVGDLSNLFVPGAGVLGKFVKFATGVKTRYDDNKVTWEKYLKKFQNMPGIYEFDPYTRLITEIVEKYKQNNDGKRVVLLIEDLDRIDPEHVFRILNIFSAHIDRKYMYDGEEQVSVNKFSLDKVVTVCDYDNLKCIFAHFYGAPTSFEGYINKFLVGRPYRYSIREVAVDYFYEYIEKYCGWSRAFCESLYSEEYINQKWEKTYFFKDAVNSISIRDIKNILENIDGRIYNRVINRDGIEFSLHNSFTRLFVICKKLRCDWGICFKAAFREYTHLIDLLKSFGILLLITEGCNKYSFRCERTLYSIELKDNYFVEVRNLQGGFVSMELSINELKKYIEKSINEYNLLSYIHNSNV